ncbi:putative aldehyde dehydrogenase [Dissostichus eleginoides]|uniref:Aldehyde dehydrogenase n=1 Tax=Dissostichus eleginoides TaxID=100907 RepID=A0AAD9EXB9_DISEL|nr:putative aldehyde dehydrogenase [Dissostichus eleginoides]
MSPAWRRGRRTGVSTVVPRTMVTAGRTGQVGQVWVSCWILLSATFIHSAQAQAEANGNKVMVKGEQKEK